MKLSTLEQLLLKGDAEVRLTPASVKVVCQHAMRHLADCLKRGDDFDDVVNGLYDVDTTRDLIQELFGELSPDEWQLRADLNQRLEQAEQKVAAQRKENEALLAKESAERTAQAAKRKQQIIDAITQASKQQKLNPLALTHCGVDDCPEPGVTLLVNPAPEGECLNFDHIADVFCSEHWRGRCGNGFPLHWNDLEFLHPAVATVCIEQKTVYKAWARNPEKFGKRVLTAKDRVNNTIKRGALVTYDCSFGDPRTSSPHTEPAFAKVENIWKVGSIRVLQMRKIQGVAKPTLRMSSRLTTKYAEKVIVLSEIPKLFRKVMA